ncbi:hypothetical protein NPIL_413391 [Nephila pilipes]|uniref:Uncharacterized protein n=1 Tax=Nephila pilipes TaxID=299642 RepID=A0A8X6QDP0_NEPPI|nr:hypothetical protein NPIL_413391 [Nephila pilipes]
MDLSLHPPWLGKLFSLEWLFRSSGSSSVTLGTRTRCQKEGLSHGPTFLKFITPVKEVNNYGIVLCRNQFWKIELFFWRHALHTSRKEKKKWMVS